MPTKWLQEVVKRSERGPFMKEKDFEMNLARRTAELVREFGLRMAPDVLVPADDDMADRLYQAGMQLVLDTGFYNMSTERCIMFTRDELEDIVAAAPGSLTLGEGKDAVVMRHRPVEGSVPCCVHSGPTGTPSSERYHPLILQSCAQEPLVDCLGAGSVSTYMGEPITAGTPLEILAARRDASVAREAVRKAGRPGMHINDVAVPLTCAGKMACFDPAGGLRPSDAFLVSQMVELKTDYDQLSRVAFMQSVDLHIVDLMTPLVGGLGGGAEGTAIVTIASHILGAVCYDASYHIYGHMHLLESTDTDRMGLWVYAIGGQALSRNTPMLSMTAIYTQAGLGTEEVLWEIAAGSVASTVSGLHHNGVGATGGSREDHTSGLENRFNAEVAHACLGLSREDANGFVLDFLSRYEENHMKNPPAGRPFAELYNTDTLEPGEEWLGLYHKVRDEIMGMGLDLDNGWRKARLAR
jgi:methylamine--corrinoid protein Co-methyltransferase